jgi:segregation and condensation protein A
MREAAAQLMNRMRLGRDVFQRGMPEGAKTIRETTHTATVYDLLRAYADQRRRTIKVGHVIKARVVWSIKDARERLERLMAGVQSAAEWMAFDGFLRSALVTADDGKTVIASSFGATLEMARDGKVEIRQEAPFAPIYMRTRQSGAESGAEWQRVV